MDEAVTAAAVLDAPAHLRPHLAPTPDERDARRAAAEQIAWAQRVFDRAAAALGPYRAAVQPGTSDPLDDADALLHLARARAAHLDSTHAYAAAQRCLQAWTEHRRRAVWRVLGLSLAVTLALLVAVSGWGGFALVAALAALVSATLAHREDLRWRWRRGGLADLRQRRRWLDDVAERYGSTLRELMAAEDVAYGRGLLDDELDELGDERA